MGYWPQRMPLFWHLDVSNLDPADLPLIVSPIEHAIASWTEVCGVKIERAWASQFAQLLVRFVDDLRSDPTAPRDPNQWALWLQGKELGLTDMPGNPGAVTQLIMRLNPNVSGGWTALKLDEVVRHEAGHFLGFNHAPAGILSCMSEFLDQRVTEQTSFDVSVAQAAYGPPTPTPVPAPSSVSSVPLAGSPPAQVLRPPAVAPATGPVQPPPKPKFLFPSATPTARRIKPMDKLAALFTMAVSPFIGGKISTLIHAELEKGSELDTAIRSVLGNLEAKIPDPKLRAAAVPLLDAALTFAEVAVGGAADKLLAPVASSGS